MASRIEDIKHKHAHGFYHPRGQDDVAWLLEEHALVTQERFLFSTMLVKLRAMPAGTCLDEALRVVGAHGKAPGEL